jgi:hypothetical protein
MSNKKPACLAVATVIGAALIAAPAQARGGGGGFGGGGMHAGAVGGFGGGGMRPAGIAPGFAGRRFVGPLFGVGVGLYAASSCWTLVPTAFGWEQVWTC